MKSAFALVLVSAICVTSAAEAHVRALRTAPNSLQPDLGSLAMRQAEDNLLHFLEVERSLEIASKQAHGDLPPHEDFQPACIAHTKKLVTSLDRAYTDVQLRSVLENECSLDKMFVSVETGFGDDDACKNFAKTLVDARNEELEKGSLEGYKKFCDGYYEFKGGKVPEKPKDEKPEKENAKKEKSKEHKSRDGKEEKPKEESKEATKDNSKEADAEKSEQKKVGDANKAEEVEKPKKVDAKENGKPAGLKEGRGSGEDKLAGGPLVVKHKDEKLHTWAVGVLVVGLVLLIIAGFMVQNRTSTGQ
mmetsp:Transcript_9784/g.18515  ORF Transcript_9784/g.18515 Transcript_9784/m.18515 type:complete len:304 (+) Transcript_9784:122-1033(+)